MPPWPRKGHRKSKTGCANCKRRKIKCNESRSGCGNCVKHRIRCDYLDAAPRTATPRTATPQSASAGPGGCSSTAPPRQQQQHGAAATMTMLDGNHLSPGIRPQLGGDPSALPQRDGSNNNGTQKRQREQLFALNAVDLELMHNFITSTSHTLSSTPEVRNLWRLEVPRIAFRHEFVLRALLAVSALHLAQRKVDPEERDFYVARALAQHCLSLREPMELLQNLTSENGAAVFVFAILTAVLGLAMPRGPDDCLIVGGGGNGGSGKAMVAGGITNWLFLLRGVASVAIESRESILSDNIAGMICQANVPLLDDELEGQRGPPPVEHEQLVILRCFLQRDVADPEELHTYLEVTNKLSRAFAFFSRSGSPVGYEVQSTFLWVYKISDGYLALLTQYQPHALLILGHYSALLHRMESLWWIRGWGAHLISLIYRQLDPDYRSLLRWPIEEIGWVPA